MTTVADIESALFAAFPREDAEGWDNPGMSVGNAASEVLGVAYALDPTVANIRAAALKGCSVLVTHHPVFIGSGPSQFGPGKQAMTPGAGRSIYEAASLGVALVAMHTNADRALCVRQRYAQMLGWPCVGSFEGLTNPACAADAPGLGVVFQLEEPLALGQVAAVCSNAFKAAPRVWGQGAKTISRIALLNGSWSGDDVYDTCISNGIDCVIVGETKYHFCSDAQPHLSVIDLGHDVSELPIVHELQAAVAASGLEPETTLFLSNEPANWWTAN